MAQVSIIKWEIASMFGLEFVKEETKEDKYGGEITSYIFNCVGHVFDVSKSDLHVLHYDYGLDYLDAAKEFAAKDFLQRISFSIPFKIRASK